MAFLYVGAGGFIGSCLRYLLSVICKHAGVAFPLGTLLSNVIAGIAIGFIIGLDRQSGLIPPQMKLFLTTGLMGGLSTFSAFSLETVDLFATGKYLAGSLNVALNLGLSLLGVVLGMAWANAMLSKA